MNPRTTRSRIAAIVVTVAVMLASLIGLGAGGAATASGNHGHGPDKPKPTVVLVHGAFADSSGWDEVTRSLIQRGYPVLAFSNPLRGPVADGDYLRQFLSTVSGPVVLVGHSYGGAVITNGATGNPNVKALVYIAAFALAEGESVAEAQALGGGTSVLSEHLVLRPNPTSAGGDADAYIDPDWFHRLFAPDLPLRTTQVMAATQRPAALATLVTPSGPAAWEDIPSWYLVANQDRVIPPQAEAAMAKRAGSTTVRINSSHVAMMSHPDAVVRLILDAAR